MNEFEYNQGSSGNAAKPTLPDVGLVAETIKSWGTTQPEFSKLLQAGVPTVPALARWALELLRGNQIADAITVLRCALALAPGDPVLWANYGMALNQNNFSSEAASCLEHSVALCRQQPHIWLMLGLARKKLGEFSAAETAFRTALEQEPHSAAAWQLLGEIKEEQKDFAEAIQCLERCLETDGKNTALLANLGKLNYQLGRIPESAAAYAKAAGLDPTNLHYRQMTRKTTFLRESLQQGGSVEKAMANYQDSFPAAEVCSEKELKELFNSAFSIFSGFGHIDAAARVGRKQLELWPENASLRYLLQALAGDSTIDRSPPEYVVEHFDAFAAGFDAQLVGALGYDIPEKLCSALRQITAVGHLYETLDAGCGTGLCGPLLRPISRVLTGVDLSPKMLEQAATKQVYDVLGCEDLITFLSRSMNQFDLIVAADLMIYFGDLTPIFLSVAKTLRPGGLFAFSTELWSGEKYRLLPSGRFAHAPEYVRALAASAFAEVLGTETTVRLDANRRLAGNIFVLRRSC